MTTGFLMVALLLPSLQNHPLSKDKTGIQWILPFKAAQEKARKEGRILLIKPVAFGTTPDGGW